MAKAQEDASDVADLMKYIEEHDDTKLQRNIEDMPPSAVDNFRGNSNGGIKIDASIGEEFNVNSFLLVDMDKEQTAMRREARKTINDMVKHLMPVTEMADVYIQNKMEQDIMTLSKLYWQRKSNELMQYSIMKSVGMGMNQPRMYEVFGQLGTKVQDISRQIVEMEHAIRKSYIDIKMESDERKADDEAAEEKLIAENETPKLLSSKDRILQAKSQYQEKLVESVGIGGSVEDQ